MKKFEPCRATCSDGKSQLFGIFIEDDGGDTEHPPQEAKINVKGMGVVEIDLMEWKVERVLPDTPGSIVEYCGRLYVLSGIDWLPTDGQGKAPDKETLRKQHKLHFDAGLILLEGKS